MRPLLVEVVRWQRSIPVGVFAQHEQCAEMGPTIHRVDPGHNHLRLCRDTGPGS